MDYDEIYSPCHGMRRIRKNEKWGFANEKGQVVIQPVYDHVTEFARPWKGVASRRIFAKVTRNGRLGVVDGTGQEILPCIFDRIAFGLGLDNAGMFQVWKGNECDVDFPARLRERFSEEP